MLLFAIATLCPFLLIAAAIAWGGIWAWGSLAFLTLLAFSLDRLAPEEIDNAPLDAEFPASNNLLVLLGLSHLAILPLSVWAIAGQSGLSLLDRAVIAVAVSILLGQISHPVAHELIHKSTRSKHLLGQLVYSSMLFGHHASAHLRVHHVYVGNDADPNSARLGESFYSFVLRTWPAGFMAGLHAENRLRKGQPLVQHPYVLYLTVALAVIIGAYVGAGLPGLSALVVIAIYSQLQILMSDYVQHYGLRRYALADGRLEPIGPQHSWNAPHWFTSAMTLNAPRHSDHHMAPSRPYPALQLDEDKMPCLPYSLPVMAGIALVPPFWRRVMDARCLRWHPVWTEPTQVTSRDIPPAVLAHAKSGSVPRAVLAVSEHANTHPDPAHDRHRNDRAVRRPDDGG